MTTTNEIYLKREEITNVQATIEDMLTKLTTATRQQGEGNHCQMVIQLNRKEGEYKWKMFVYYDHEKEIYRYSFQNEEYYDTDIMYHNTRADIIGQINYEIADVDGFEWISVDF